MKLFEEAWNQVSEDRIKPTLKELVQYKWSKGSNGVLISDIGSLEFYITTEYKRTGSGFNAINDPNKTTYTVYAFFISSDKTLYYNTVLDFGSSVGEGPKSDAKIDLSIAKAIKYVKSLGLDINQFWFKKSIGGLKYKT